MLLLRGLGLGGPLVTAGLGFGPGNGVPPVIAATVDGPFMLNTIGRMMR